MPPSAQQSDTKTPARAAAPATAWDDRLLANPHAVADKRRRVRDMFAAIAPSYDINNRLHSLWQDQRWRRRAVVLAKVSPTDIVVDVACGTGDLALQFYWEKAFENRRVVTPKPRHVIGADFTFQMLPIARKKFAAIAERWSNDYISKPVPRPDDLPFINGDAQSLPLPDQSADVVSIAFGIRNVQDPAAAIKEFFRILRPGGRVIILEFSLPTNRLLRGLYNFYFRQVLPRTATLISGDKTGAYKYLPESVNTFIGRDQMMQMLETAGFEKVEHFPMTFGVCVCYRGVKPAVAPAPTAAAAG
jgi:demethylmenaquinone methyltransferase/2-methoxy-6-polyprenyl-1,4-benzoquinol methylase